jgi:hypothetical protein
MSRFYWLYPFPSRIDLFVNPSGKSASTPRDFGFGMSRFYWLYPFPSRIDLFVNPSGKSASTPRDMP